MGGKMEPTSIQNTVLAYIRTLAPKIQIDLRHKLIADLGLEGDDTTALAIYLERHFRIRVPQSDWAEVSTVRDLIDVIERHLGPSSR
jgi:acyl carrier protein